MRRVSHVFIGSEALAAGDVTRHGLASGHRRVLPDVYVPRREPLSLHDRAVAAWLWSRRRGVVTGQAAAALHGAKWVDDTTPIELNFANNKTPAGVVTRNETLLDTEVVRLRAMAVTAADRTAFDLARRGPVAKAVERLDALSRATHFKAEDVLRLADLHPHVRGIRRVAAVLDLVDEGAQSPKETWLRLLLMDAGFPRPQTQIPVLAPNGDPRYYLDMGWPEVMVAVEYDGEHHRTDRPSYTNDIVRLEYIAAVGWIVVRVVAGNRRAEIINRARRAWASRGPLPFT